MASDHIKWVTPGLVIRVHGTQEPVSLVVEDITPTGWVKGMVVQWTEGGERASKKAQGVAVNLNQAIAVTFYPQVKVEG